MQCPPPATAAAATREVAEDVGLLPEGSFRDLRGKAAIPAGETAHITFSNAAPGCIWTLTIVYSSDRSSAVRRNTDTTSATFA